MGHALGAISWHTSSGHLCQGTPSLRSTHPAEAVLVKRGCPKVHCPQSGYSESRQGPVSVEHFCSVDKGPLKECFHGLHDCRCERLIIASEMMNGFRTKVA